ncbi:hypothetical protein [Streptococcus pseudoporcinus]|uniref:V-type ATP synthase subunit G n=1 Tax=Streptococcus pseudoporcinus TaxID=361101 RepID=A0A4U9XHF6_9STRE|nr:hypothetical protein [Streptococcus pseudoporcinus]VTS12366.1 V-type ATP synthase subunit G [Streptococcus pseudoporcinus]VUC64892.1 V-type ATP synthase subunit G [Streptococcus pseudoporcinus]VUC95385.1 V-type ATP synthase subunit G [Streptococcus pseudoporcinus]VUC95772.1 V-type ATP synthase subunit G [Streptococcus pseudoporcinus]
MTNSIISKMASIEVEAKVIYESYEAKRLAHAIQLKDKLEALRLSSDLETQKQVGELKESLEKALAQEEAAALARQEKQKRALEGFLADQKEHLVDQIVDRVVEKYGD